MFTTKKYTWVDILSIPFKISPLLLSTFFLLEFTQALLSTLGIVYITSYFVNAATNVLSNGFAISMLYRPLALLLGVNLVSTLLTYFIKLSEVHIKEKLSLKLEPEILERRASLKYHYIENEESWELIERLSNGILYNFQDGIRGTATIMHSIISIASILSIIVLHAWWAASLIALISIPLFVLSLKAGKSHYNAWMAAWPYERRYSYYSDDLLTNLEASQERTLFGFADYVISLHQQHFETARKIQDKVARKNRITMESTGVFMTIIALFITFSLIQPVMNGHLSPGLFMGITTAVYSLATTMGGTLQNAAKELSYARSCMNDLTEFMSLDLEDGVRDLPASTPPHFESLTLKNVSFKYPNSSNYVIKNLSFSLDAKKHYAIVGKNGSGKTTLIKLLLGLYDHYEGEILINNKELRTYSQASLKAMFSVVYQDFAKYQITLSDNIALGNAGKILSPTLIQEASDKVELTATIQNLKNGLSTLIGKINPKGVDLSGGQWQKIAIARSIISPAPIKILDEPTASLDPIAESKIYTEFETLMTDNTTIFISHRLGSTKLADEILVIDNGQLIEQGTHQDLLKLNGMYAEMFESQKRWYL